VLSRRPLIVSAAAAVVAVSAVAQAEAAKPKTYAAPPIKVGTYSPTEKSVTANTSAEVNVVVTNAGKKLDFVGLSCNSGPDPGQGVMADTTQTILLPGPLAISAGGTFAWSGKVTLTPEDTQSGVSATSRLSIKGKFTSGKITWEKTVAVRGTVSASICAAAPSPTFSLVFDTPSTAR
jgi:hypothetical protein